MCTQDTYIQLYHICGKGWRESPRFYNQEMKVEDKRMTQRVETLKSFQVNDKIRVAKL